MKFKGFVREDGQVGSRNYVAVIPSVVCINEVVEHIVDMTEGSRGILHHQGCCQLPPDLKLITDALIRIGQNANAGAALVVSLGCEGVNAEEVVEGIAATGKPVEMVRFQELGGTSKTVQRGVDLVQKMGLKISSMEREEVDLRHLTMGIKCGASDATSGVASNPVIGYVADKVVDAGGTVMFGETTEFIGAEHILARRAKNDDVANRIYEIVRSMEERAKSMGVDMRKGQPTPGNIAGGLSSIEEKSLGAIVKSGTRTIQGVLEYAERPNGKGLFAKDTPGREIEVLTAMAIGGAQAILFSTGRGAPQGFPIVPVIKICGNPVTYGRLANEMDINAGGIVSGDRSIEEVGEESLQELLHVLSGALTKGEEIKYTKSMDIYTLGPII
jgi:altronate dehydratase large subunit